MERSNFSSTHLEGEIMAIVTVGIDLAKNIFAVHGVDETGKPALVRPEVPRAKLLELIANLPACLIGMEACSGAHHWAREFAKFGHTVRLMAPKFVAPYRMSGKRGKNDAADAAAICEAVTRPNMRFVPVKSIEQQSRLFVHRARQGYVEQRTSLINRIRGLLSDLGIVLPLKAATVGKGHDFSCGRQFCAWLGLVPGQYSSGGKKRLGRITKAGDPYLRTLLILGGKAVLAAAKNKTDPVSRWAISVQERRGYWKAVVAIAAKNARMCWAMLQRGEAFKLPA
jgi:transposase